MIRIEFQFVRKRDGKSLQCVAVVLQNDLGNEIDRQKKPWVFRGWHPNSSVDGLALVVWILWHRGLRSTVGGPNQSIEERVLALRVSRSRARANSKGDELAAKMQPLFKALGALAFSSKLQQVSRGSLEISSVSFSLDNETTHTSEISELLEKQHDLFGKLEFEASQTGPFSYHRFGERPEHFSRNGALHPSGLAGVWNGVIKQTGSHARKDDRIEVLDVAYDAASHLHVLEMQARRTAPVTESTRTWKITAVYRNNLVMGVFISTDNPPFRTDGTFLLHLDHDEKALRGLYLKCNSRSVDPEPFPWHWTRADASNEQTLMTQGTSEQEPEQPHREL